MTTAAWYYDEANNPNGASFPGVPLRDLTQEEYDALPSYIQADIAASPLYRKTPTRAASKPRAEAEKE